jgi:hypothetical protein
VNEQGGYGDSVQERKAKQRAAPTGKVTMISHAGIKKDKTYSITSTFTTTRLFNRIVISGHRRWTSRWRSCLRHIRCSLIIRMLILELIIQTANLRSMCDDLPKQGRKSSRWQGEPTQDVLLHIYNHTQAHLAQLPYGAEAG